ncbi:MAG TPA: hypothetical protein ENL19_02345 [candidate division WOR-3 bacterium]|uniref:PD-(D/E)XK endonuclease-like domain-containing protein n=1 Tax=candidate division WOR-3 bacterium TaxID=2052148 RepID=A0A7C5DF28_UNCW3|nr:hypothetical protein [candidate division WOR-3 bacterium]
MSDYLLKLSASTLNVFLDCPRCFWIMMNKKIRRPRGPMPSITTGMDSIIKKYFEGFRQKKELPPFLEGKLPVKLIDRLPQALYYKPKDLDALLWGKLDECVVFEDNTYAALDHKTKGSSPKDVHPAFKFQMDVYTLLLEENGYHTRNLAFLIYYFPSEPLTLVGFNFKVEVHPIRTDPQNAFRVFRQALEILKKPIPQPSSECEYCRYFQSLKNIL